jgi:choline dehydrogenase
MRSGIGPADHLKALRIDVLVDLAGVGEDLMDHPLLWLSFDAKPQSESAEGPLFQTLLTLKSSGSVREHDLQVIPSSISMAENENGSGSADFNMLVALVKPFSHGQLRLRSRNPDAAPLIDLGYFTHPDDMPRLIEAIRAARNLAKTPPLSRLLGRETFPGSRTSSASSLKSALLRAVATYHHPVGTCRMGPASDNGAVVDSHGNVHGVDGLSVIDASIMPTIPSANTNLPTIMIAERCSDWLK